MTVIFPGGDFLEFILNCNKNKFLAGNIPVIKSSLFEVVVLVEERRRRGWKNRHMRDNIPCREACAVKLAPDHTSKLDAVLVDPCFIQCLLARREERRRERREEREKRNRKGGGGRERSKERSKDRKEERERAPPLSPPVLMSSTPPCVVSKRLRVKRQDARMLNTCGRLAATHGGVLNQHTEACWT